LDRGNESFLQLISASLLSNSTGGQLPPGTVLATRETASEWRGFGDAPRPSASPQAGMFSDEASSRAEGGASAAKTVTSSGEGPPGSQVVDAFAARPSTTAPLALRAPVVGPWAWALCPGPRPITMWMSPAPGSPSAIRTGGDRRRPRSSRSSWALCP